MTTKEQVIELAKQAGASRYTNRHYPDRPTHTFTVDQLETYTRLVREQYRAELLAGSGEPALPKGVGISASFSVDYYAADQQAATALRARNQALEDAAVCCEAFTRTPETNGLELTLAAAVIRNMKDNT